MVNWTPSGRRACRFLGAFHPRPLTTRTSQFATRNSLANPTPPTDNACSPCSENRVFPLCSPTRAGVNWKRAPTDAPPVRTSLPVRVMLRSCPAARCSPRRAPGRSQESGSQAPRPLSYSAHVTDVSPVRMISFHAYPARRTEDSGALCMTMKRWRLRRGIRNRRTRSAQVVSAAC
jgi:hypothetical protein